MTGTRSITIFSLTGNGRKMAQRLLGRFPDATHHHRVRPFVETAQKAFVQGQDCLFICATGIVVRALAPVLRDKTRDPGVIVIDDAGQFVIPLLSSHEGGAGELAEIIADELKARVVVTSATHYGRPVYTLGVGCDRGCPAETIAELVETTIAAMTPVPPFQALASIDIKSNEPGLRSQARKMGLELKTYGATRLRTMENQLSEKSELVFREVGCYGVAEAAALLAASEITQRPAELVITKQKNRRATVAVARSYAQ